MQPRLSVVVPIYNVEDYLEDCLRSLAGQTIAQSEPAEGDADAVGFEVVLVDDGSTDGSTDIARAFAERDPRFRYVHQQNAGLSAARNTGVRHASPDATYLTFVDSDDVVAHDTYARMIASLDASGSDFATGNVWRLNERGRQQAWQYKWLTESRTRTHITRDPELLADRVAWNKVFRRDFWDKHAFEFPEGKLYEDTPVMIPAHFLATSVDVLAEHVYYWRVREGSITRRRTDVKGVRDRIAACAGVSAFLGERFPGQKRTYDLSCLRDDFLYFLDGLPMGGPEYRAAFLADTAAFLRDADASVIAELPVDLRVKWQLVREERLADLVELLAFEQANGTAFRVQGALARSAVYPSAAGGRLDVDPKLTRIGSRELPVVARVVDASWGADGKLTISGYAYVRNLEAARPGQSVKAGILKSAHSRGQFRRVPTTTVASPYATESSRQQLHSYDQSGFEMTIDPRKLKIRGRWRPGNWLLGVVVAGHGTVRRAAVRSLDGAAAQSVVRELADGLRLVLAFSKGRLVLRVERYAARVESHALDGGDVVLTGRVHGGPEPKALRLTHKDSKAELDCPVACALGRFSVRIPLADLEAVPPTEHRAPREVEPPHGDRWQANLVLPDGSLKSVAAVCDLPPGRYATQAGREVCATANDAGQLVVELTRQPVADVVRWTDEGALVVEGWVSEASWYEAELVLRHSTRDEEVTVAVERDGGRFRASFAPASADDGLSLREGRWYAFLREVAAVGEDDRVSGDGSAISAGPRRLDGVPVRLLASVGAGLPLAREHGGRTFTADRRFGDRLLLDSGPVLPAAERSAYSRARLRTVHYPAQRQLPLQETVLYFDGDSPRAVHEELVRRGTDLEHLWVAHDGQTRIPAGARAVELHSTAWYEALARARHIVTAGHLPDFFERREGQHVVQTWHGAPLKRIGKDLTDTLYADHAHVDALPRLTAQWSLLVSPNRHSIPHMSRALSYQGEVLQAGSPRNDVLFADDRAKIADRVRRDLGIEEGKRVVLYAPTHRDHLAYEPGRFRYEAALDFREAERALGEDHVLLVRKHPLATGRLPGGRAPFVRDVSAYPQVAELLLITDVLVTDYSSLVFDFAHTGRPMLFHTYDLEHYRDTVRGFYLDFETRAPGPLLATTGELIEALLDVDTIAARHADVYAAFRQAYCDLDDGRAAGRVADRMLR
ncbi:CDP-glycerol glycerophosphotransferase family protein [Streptomyces sp. NBC_01304]|uniref:CDP-glycerol glycerophosphotransferase family protein n=1 Tax=Streptomyces sp. NBC_01304 TaxID=2903818 RepID=UPI002E144CAF|nr:CDP-glycerol glycerophosphotransferase family protein [Streptomyces sp. NBC_01304]